MHKVSFIFFKRCAVPTLFFDRRTQSNLRAMLFCKQTAFYRAVKRGVLDVGGCPSVLDIVGVFKGVFPDASVTSLDEGVRRGDGEMLAFVFKLILDFLNVSPAYKKRLLPRVDVRLPTGEAVRLIGIAHGQVGQGYSESYVKALRRAMGRVEEKVMYEAGLERVNDSMRVLFRGGTPLNFAFAERLTRVLSGRSQGRVSCVLGGGVMHARYDRARDVRDNPKANPWAFAWGHLTQLALCQSPIPDVGDTTAYHWVLFTLMSVDMAVQILQSPPQAVVTGFAHTTQLRLFLEKPDTIYGCLYPLLTRYGMEVPSLAGKLNLDQVVSWCSDVKDVVGRLS